MEQYIINRILLIINGTGWGPSKICKGPQKKNILEEIKKKEKNLYD
jgi:hypothetical protein